MPSPQKKRDIPPGFIYRGQQELSKACGVSTTTIAKWVTKGLPHEKVRGVYEFDSAKVFDWRLQQERQGQLEDKDNRDRKARLDGDKVEYELEAMRGNLIVRDVLEKVLSAGLRRMRGGIFANMRSLAGDLARESDPRVCQELLRDDYERAFRELTSGADATTERDVGREHARSTVRRASEAAAEADDIGLGGRGADSIA